MNILLDYFFKVTQINPIPAGSTAFLKQACVVVKPKAGVTPGTVSLCTSMAQVQALTDNTEAQQLFNAGLTRVYVLPVATLDLASILESQGSNFFTILVSSDFSDTDVGGVNSSATVNFMTYRATQPGVVGDSIEIIYVDSKDDATAEVTVNGTQISVGIEAGVTTLQTILNALEAHETAKTLVSASIEATHESDTQAANAGFNLAGGLNPMAIGTFEGVVGVSSVDKAWLKSQAAIRNRCAFYATALTGAKNLFYAFGKLLANPLNWYNQQYIEMPFSDGVNTLGDSNNLFDDRISFVIQDAQFSNRLGFFACGGQAIVAPYILKNLVIEMQSTALNYVAINQPQYTPTEAALIEDELQKVIDEYVVRQWIENGNIEIKLEQANFVASGYIEVSEPSALWRFFVELRQS